MRLPKFTRIAAWPALLLVAVAGTCAATEWKRLSPFQALEIKADAVHVRVAGAPYECLAIDGLATAEILAWCRTNHGGKWEKRFAEDLVEVLAGMGRPPGTHVQLRLRDAAGKEVEIKAEMTAENRQAIMAARYAAASPASAGPAAPARAERPDPSRRLTPEQAAEDLQVLARAIEERHSYAKVAGVDAGAALKAASGRLGAEPRVDALAEEIAEVLARLGDCHARVRGIAALRPRGFTPFRMEDVGGRVVALASDDTLLDAQRPFVTTLDGRPVVEWLAVASRAVPACSVSFVQLHALDTLAAFAHVRARAAAPSNALVAVGLAPAAGDAVTLNLPLAERPPQPRATAPTSHRVLDGNVGYLRIASMDDGPELTALLRDAMKALSATRSLVVDVRGNGGGSREALRLLMPMLMRPDEPPRVVNVAAYRLPADERPERPQGHLEDRFLFPLTWSGWTAAERKAIEAHAATFRPAWAPPPGEFTAWHWLAISPGVPEGTPRHAGPVAVLMDGECFSATDIFLGALKGRLGVLLVGTPSGGGSGRVRPVRLPNSGLEILLSTMASFRPDGSRYDGAGIAPDVVVERTLDDALGRADSQLMAALALIR